MMLENKKIQFTVNPVKEKVVYDLIQRLEEESQERGYVNDQLKIRLHAFELLAQQFNERDPIALAMKLAAGATSAPAENKSAASNITNTQPKITPPKNAEFLKGLGKNIMSELPNE
jgi:hypothetical protein